MWLFRLIGGKMPKKTLNVFADEILIKRFREQADHYGKRVGQCLTAAMLQWLETDPKLQGEYLKRIFEAQVNEEVEALVEATKKEQAARIEQREQRSDRLRKRNPS